MGNHCDDNLPYDVVRILKKSEVKLDIRNHGLMVADELAFETLESFFLDWFARNE